MLRHEPVAPCSEAPQRSTSTGLVLHPSDIASARARMESMRGWLLEQLPADLPPARLADEATLMLAAYLRAAPSPA